MPNQRTSSLQTLVYCALFAALIAVGAFIQIPVPFMDYFTLQFLFVLLAGMILGPARGALAVGAYLVIGLVGFPVFAAGGGIGYVLRPTFGYLLGFLVAAFVTGLITQKADARERGYGYYLLAALAGMLVTYAIGFGYKYAILNFYTKETTALWPIIAASLPLDIPGDFVLCLVSAGLGPRLRRILQERQES